MNIIDTDLQQTFYRMYDAALGRFIAVDPEAEASESVTTYHYALNNPIMFNDPLGDKADLNPGTGPYANFWSQFWAFSGSGDRNAFYTNKGDGVWNTFTNSIIITGDEDRGYDFALGLRQVDIKEVYSNPNWLADRQQEALKEAKLDGSIFYGINVYTNRNLDRGQAFTLPGIGIFTNPNDIGDVDLLMHEYGHILQANKIGKLGFYGIVAKESLFSAFKQGYDKNFNHKDYWTETTANDLSYDFFNRPNDWRFDRFPLSKPKVQILIAPNDVYNTLFNY